MSSGWLLSTHSCTEPITVLSPPSRLKELLLRERSGRCELKNRVEELEARCRSLTQQVEQARSSEEQHKAALYRLEENISQGESLRAQQQAEEVQLYSCSQGQIVRWPSHIARQTADSFKENTHHNFICGASDLLQSELKLTE